MEGTKLEFVREKQRAYGLLKVFKNKFYEIMMCYCGDLEEDRKTGLLEKGYLKVEAIPNSSKTPGLMILPAVKQKEPRACIKTEDVAMIECKDVDDFIIGLTAGKETLKEIDRVIKNEYPDFHLF